MAINYPEAATTRFRNIMRQGPFLAAGTFDALSSHLVQKVGFEVGYISGLSVEATQLASADIGMLTRPEMAQQAARIVRAADIPFICDIDTGFGDGMHIAETIRAFERVGVAAVHIEDQQDPKTCPNLEVPKVLPLERALSRLRIALDARTDPDFCIIARTDADAVSFDEAVYRANAYLDLGADMVLAPLMVVNGKRLKSLPPNDQFEWLTKLVREVDGPLIGFVVPEGYRASDLMDAGYKGIISAASAVDATATALIQLYEDLLGNGNGNGFFSERPRDERVVGEGLAKSLGIEEAQALRSRFN